MVGGTCRISFVSQYIGESQGHALVFLLCSRSRSRSRSRNIFIIGNLLHTYGKFKVESDVKKILSFVYGICCDSYQRSIITKFEDVKWKLMKSVPELVNFVKFIKELKVNEKGSKVSVIAKARKAISSIQQHDFEDGNTYVARAQR